MKGSDVKYLMTKYKCTYVYVSVSVRVRACVCVW